MTVLAVVVSVLAFTHPHPRKHIVPVRVMRFWARVADCETGGDWRWGSQFAHPVYEGGVGFYWRTWQTWAGELHVLRRFPHAYDAPKEWQARVAQYGLTVHDGYWGCLH